MGGEGAAADGWAGGQADRQEEDGQEGGRQEAETVALSTPLQFVHTSTNPLPSAALPLPPVQVQGRRAERG